MTSKVLDALAQAEEKLQFVIGESARCGEYAVSKAASAVAEEIMAIQVRLRGAALPSRPAAGTSAPATPLSRAKGGRKSNYPKFEFRGGQLYRIGWSKKEKKEYSHKVSREVYDRVVKGMQSTATSGTSPLMIDALLEGMRKTTNEGVSSYQVYVVVGFLKARGIIQQEGRQGYRFPEDLVSQASEAWGR